MKNKGFTPTPICNTTEKLNSESHLFYGHFANPSTTGKLVRGFTLVELLVVVSIIAILLAVLMPALNKAREQGKTIICSNNEKQLYTAWYTYATANGGKIVCSLTYKTYDEGDIRADTTRYSWVWAPYDVVTNKSIKEKGKPVQTLEQEQEGIKRGKLYAYASDFDLFHCPSVMYQEGKGHFRSYSVPDNLNGEPTINPNHIYSQRWYNWTNLSQIARPAERFVFIEENDDSRNYNVDSWAPDLAITANDATLNGDPVTIRHGGVTRSCFSFADGHNEQKRWSSEYIKHIQYYDKTKMIYGFRAFTLTSEQGRNDILWLKKGMPWKK